MSIDLNKAEEQGGGATGRPNYNDPNSSPEVRETYVFAYECKGKNMVDYQIEQSLQNRGLTSQEAGTVLNIVNRAMANRNMNDQAPAPSGGGGVPKILIYVGILILVNVLSAAFGWGFWIY